MSDEVRMPYEAAKHLLLEILQNDVFWTDEDVLKLLNRIINLRKGELKSVGLSRIKIDEKSRIYFPEYSMKEISMPYLLKTVFVFFLFHPEGQCFKQLCDFKQELYRIYQIIAVEKNMDAFRMKKSIENLVDPYSNSIHEVRSRIHEKLSKVVPQEVLEQYCIDGKRGEKYSVALHRSLVCVENEELRKFINY